MRLKIRYFQRYMSARIINLNKEIRSKVEPASKWAPIVSTRKDRKINQECLKFYIRPAMSRNMAVYRKSEPATIVRNIQAALRNEERRTKIPHNLLARIKRVRFTLTSKKCQWSKLFLKLRDNRILKMNVARSSRSMNYSSRWSSTG